MRLPCWFAVLLPQLVLAQGISPVILDVAGNTTKVITRSTCGDPLQVGYSVTLLGAMCSSFKIWVTQATSCADAQAAGEPLVGEKSVTELQLQRTGYFTLSPTDLPGLSGGDGGVQCGDAQEVEQKYYVCGAYTYSSYSCVSGSTLVAKSTSPPTILYDTKPPAMPSIIDVLARDSAAQVDFSASTDTVTVHAETRVAGAAGFVPNVDAQATAGSLRLTGLENGVTYDVRIFGEDAAGNLSPATEPVRVTPIHVDGFFGGYVAAGGHETGGCSTAGALLLPLAGLLAVGALRRRRS